VRGCLASLFLELFSTSLKPNIDRRQPIDFQNKNYFDLSKTKNDLKKLINKESKFGYSDFSRIPSDRMHNGGKNWEKNDALTFIGWFEFYYEIARLRLVASISS
jgi:hypothetical protein